MRGLFDVSMLLALFDSAHVFNVTARQWWSKNSDHGWASCPLTENGFLRVVSQRGYSSPPPLASALALLRGWAAPPRHAFWPDDVSLMDAKVFDHGHILGPGQITDIYLLALAVKHGGRLVTFDRGMSVKTVRGAGVQHLVIIG